MYLHYFDLNTTEIGKTVSQMEGNKHKVQEEKRH